MLQVQAPFPHAGSLAYVKGTAEPREIIQRNADGTCVVKVLPKRHMTVPERFAFARRGASLTHRIDFADLCATVEEALPPRHALPTGTPLSRAKAALRAQGWTVTGRRRCGYIVKRGGERRLLTADKLPAFAGLSEP